MLQTKQLIPSLFLKSLKPGVFLFACLVFSITGQSFAQADNTLADNALTDNYGLRFSNVWIAEAPPVSRVLAAYMKIENHSDKDIRLSSATSSSFSSTAFHKTIFEDGLAKMRHQDSLIIPANGSLELKRGGLHMMLFNPVTPLREGDSVSFSFVLDNAKSDNQKAITVKAKVRKAH